MDRYTTQDYSVANWLVFNRVTLLGSVEYPGDSKKHFVFIDSDRIPDLIKEWQDADSEPAKTCKRFFQSHTIIKNALKESMDVR